MTIADYDEGFRAGLKFADEVVADLETRWRASAARTREEGTRRFLFFGGTYVAREWERVASGIDGAASGLAAIRKVLANQKRAQRS
jgi:hypothetical protein